MTITSDKAIFFQPKAIDTFLSSPQKHIFVGTYYIDLTEALLMCIPQCKLLDQYMVHHNMGDLVGNEVSANKMLGPVVQSIVSLTSSLRVILLTVLADSIYSILIFFAEKM